MSRVCEDAPRCGEKCDRQIPSPAKFAENVTLSQSFTTKALKISKETDVGKTLPDVWKHAFQLKRTRFRT